MMAAREVKLLKVQTLEHLEGDYGLYTWPCAPVLAQYVYSQREHVTGRKIIELGAGTAVPGIVAVKCGASVILSDREGSPRLQHNLKRTCEINHVPVGDSPTPTVGVVSKIMGLSWGVFSPELLGLGSQDIILASDCFYDSKDFEDIVATVSFFMGKNSNCVFWTTYQERSSNRTLLPLLERWGMCCRSVPLEFYPGEAGEQVEVEGLSKRISSSSHTIHMWEITKKPVSLASPLDV